MEYRIVEREAVDGIALEVKNPIPADSTDGLLDALESCMGGASSKHDGTDFINVETSGYSFGEPGTDPSIGEAIDRADKSAQELDITPLEYCPERLQAKRQWPTVAIQFEDRGSRSRGEIPMAIEKMKEVVAIYREEGVPFFFDLRIFLAPRWNLQMPPEQRSNLREVLP